MSARNTKDARNTIATALGAALIGAGKPTQVVSSGVPSRITKDPVVVVTSGMPRRERMMGSSKFRNWFPIEVAIWVGAENASEGWTPTDVEDVIGDIEQEIANYVLAKPRSDGLWDDLYYAEGETGSPILDVEDEEGRPFSMAVFELVVRIDDA